MTTGSGAVLIMPDVCEDIELAYRGKHGFGGHVAEIYAYRLLPRHRERPIGAHDFTEQDGREAALNLRAFRVIHPDAVFSIEAHEELDIDVGDDANPISPFHHRIHLRVEPRYVDEPKIAIYLNWKDDSCNLCVYRVILIGRSIRLEFDGGKDALGARYWKPIKELHMDLVVIALRAITDGKCERSYSNGILELRVPGTFEPEV